MIAFGTVGVMPETGGMPSVHRADLLMHFLGWIAGAACGGWAYPFARRLFLASALWAYSFAIELAQVFVPTRSFDPLDLIANAAGIAVALLGFDLIRGRRAE
ncbi:MAG: VanZ family protein [Thermoanaerobaculia bacterium]|nr:VanZ family protein [Thermoanaerobaculia bacterium]